MADTKAHRPFSPLDHLFGADQGDLVIYASQLEALLEQAVWKAQHMRADFRYGDELDAAYRNLRASMVIKEAERTR